MSRIVWIGDYHVSTGFARAGEAIVERLVDKGHEVWVLASNYRGDSKPTRVQKVYMASQKVQSDIYGYSRVIEVLGEAKPDVVVLFNDPFILNHYLFRNRWDPDLILLKYRPLITYQPRDGNNGPRSWDALREIKADGKPFTVSQQIAMSKFGQQQMPGSLLAYHGVDTETFRPTLTKRAAKEALGYSGDEFLVLRVDQNQWRKDYASTWKALLPVMKRHSDIVVHFHAANDNPLGGGVQMPELFTRDPETAVRFKLPKDYVDYDGWNLDRLITLYTAADLFVSTSMGEGFGLTIAESLACGTPVIAQNVSAIPEVVGPGGILVEGGYVITAPGGQDMYAADIGGFSEAIEHLYLNAGFRRRFAKAGMAHVKETFPWETATSVFDTAIRDLHQNTELAYSA